MEPLSRSERAGLCNSALEAGADAPTLCPGWTVKDLVIHLLVRERDPLGAPGILVPRLEGLTDRAARRLSDHDFSALVERVRTGPPMWSPLAIGAVDRAVNGMEYFVHHEDVRRAAPGWAPRELTEREQGSIWKLLGFAGRGLVRPAGVPVQVRWTGTAEAGTEADRTQTLRRGEDPAVVSGQPSEIALYVFGRDQHHGLSFEGPPESVAALDEGRASL